MKSLSFFVLLGTSLIAANCSSDSDDPGADSSTLASFAGSDCKEFGGASSGSHFRSLPPDNTSAYDGLSCIRWDADSRTVEFINYPQACGAEWEGDASLSGNEVTLTVDNPDCSLAACGTCFYDWSFELSSFPTDGDLSVSAEIDSCPNEDGFEGIQVSLPLDESPSSILCRHPSASALVWRSMPGGLHMPCHGDDNPGSNDGEIGCDDGLVCNDQGICLAECETDTECPLPDLQTCSEGVCELITTW